MTFLYNHNEIKSLDNIAFTLFGIEVYWYGILIVTGASLALYFGLKSAKRLNLNKDMLVDGFLYGLIVGVLGARIWYVIFQWDVFRGNFFDIFNFRKGGLAIHGAFVFALIYAIIYCRIRKINVLKAMELIAPGFLIGQIFGRWGNFLNQEAHGGLVPGWPDLDAQRSWLKQFRIPDFIVDQMYIAPSHLNSVTPGIGYYHPTFLYEFLWNVIGLSLILLSRKFSKYHWVGDALFMYLIWYSIGRFLIEYLRTDALMVGGLMAAQVTSVIMFIIGVVGFILRRVYRIYPFNYKEFQEEV